jgi:hypothetical protein
VDTVLQQLYDENEIRKLVVRFSIGMDLRDVDLFRSAWADQIELDLPPLAGRAVSLSGRQRADDYAKNVIALLSEFDMTQHVSTNHLVTAEGDSGKCTCYTVAQHSLRVESEERWLTAGARYDLMACRLAGLGWRFVEFKLTHLWSRGDTTVWEEVTRRLRAKKTS